MPYTSPITPTLSTQNYASLQNNVIAASSVEGGFPLSRLRDPGSAPVRTKTGWTFGPRFNWMLPFKEGGVKRVGFLSGNYPSGTEMATAATTAMNAAGIDPIELAPTGWWNPSSLNLSNDGVVTSYLDLSGNSRNLVATGNVLLKHNAVAGLPAIYFDGGCRLNGTGAWTIGNLFAAQAKTMVLVVAVSPAVPASGVVVWMGPSPDQIGIQYTLSGATLSGYNYDGTLDGETKSMPLDATWHIVSLIHDASKVYLQIDDQDAAAMTGAATGATTANCLNAVSGYFSVGAGPAGGSPFKGWMSDLLTFNKVLTEEERRRLVAYLKQKHAISENTTAPTWTNTYTVSYGAGTKKSTIARASGAATLDLPWTAYAESCGLDLGFSVAADGTGATSYVGANTAYQSRHWVSLDHRVALTHKFLAMLNHNLTAGGTVVVQFSTTGLFHSPADSVTLTAASADQRLRCLYSAAKTYRYARFVVTDVQNPDGFAQFSKTWCADYFRPLRGIIQGYKSYNEDLGSVIVGDTGSLFRDAKPIRKVLEVTFKSQGFADKEAWDALERYLGIGTPFFFSEDPQNFPERTRYVAFMKLGQWQHRFADGDPPERWEATHTLIEAL